MEAENVEISIIFPCLNEEQTIGACVAAAQSVLDSAGIHGEIIVADNDSTDASCKRASGAGAIVVNVKRPGYGSALRDGLSAARGRYLFFLDADMSYDCADIPRLFEELRSGADVVIGSRTRGTIDAGAMPWSHRMFGTPMLTLVANILFRCGISDINCGLRGMTRDAFGRMELCSDGMEFASEMMIKAARSGMKIAEAPIRFHKDQRGRQPHLRSFQDGWRHLQLMLHYASLWFLLLPGLACVLLGLLCFLPTDLTAGLLLLYLSGHCLVVVGIFIMLLGLAAQGRVRSTKYSRLAHSPLLRLVAQWVRIGTALVLGLGVMLGSVAVLAYLVIHHGPQGTPPANSMRNLMLTATAFVSGAEVFFVSAFLGLFGIRVSNDELGLPSS